MRGRLGRPGFTVAVVTALICGVAGAARAQQRVEAAEIALRSGRYEDAISLFSDIAGNEPDNARAARGHVRALVEVGRYEEAEQAARRFIRMNSTSPDLFNSLGQVLYLRGSRDEAAAAFERAVAGGADDAIDARLNRAILHYESGQRAVAMREFDEFIDIYNRNSDLSSEELTAVATAVRYLGKDDPQLFKDALRAYDEAIAADPNNLEPRLLVGELFLKKYNSADAAKAFEDVLALNPSHPRALLGQAKRSRFDSQPGALGLTRRSLEINPNLVPALVFHAELLLELEDYTAAAEQAERALEVNAASLEALSVLAAARYLVGETDGFKETVSRALAFNPEYAEIYVTLSQIGARNRLYHEAVDFAQRAVELNPKSWRGYQQLGINQLRTGLIDEGLRNLEVAFEGDPYDVWTKNTLDLMDTFVDYDVKRTPRFIITIDGKEAELLSLYFADLAEEAYERLADYYGHRPETPIRIEVYRSHADFSVRTVGLVGMGALGVSFGPVIAMDSPSARDAGDFNWGSTLWHELAHTFHLALSRHRVPRWFSEGLAVYEERRARPGWGDDVSPGFLTAYLQDRLLPVSELNKGFARPAYPQQLIYSYYEASLVCEFIEREAGPQALVEMLNLYRQGSNTDQALRSVVGMGGDAIDEAFFDYLEERFAGPLAAMRPARETGEGGPPTREMIANWAQDDPGDFTAQLAYGHILFEDGDYDAAVAYLERAKALFPEYAGAGSPYWYLAQIHRKQGSEMKAAQELAALTAINERHYAALLELADLRQSSGDIAAAADALARVMYIYPYDMALHARLAELYTGGGDHAGAIRERQAVLAQNPVDRAEAQYQLARSYYDAGDLANARRAVLMALERAPSFEAAQDLLLEIRAKSGGGT